MFILTQPIDEGNRGYGSCEINQCRNDNMINIYSNCIPDLTFTGRNNHQSIQPDSQCHEKGSQGPCLQSNILNTKNLFAEPMCLRINSHAIIPPTSCTRGSKRDFAGMCRKLRKVSYIYTVYRHIYTASYSHG